MRLATCVAIELGVGAVALAGTCAAVMFGAAQLSRELGREAMAAEARPAITVPHLAAELPRVIDARVGDRPVAVAPMDRPGSGAFEGQPDDLLLAPLRTAAVTEVKFNRGGSSLSLRLDFEGGARAAFKPNQTNLQTIPRREVAAYRVARVLGLGNVSPSIGRRFTVAELEAALPPEARGQWARFDAEAVREGEYVSGQLSFWIPDIVDAAIEGFPVDSSEGIVTWSRYLTQGVELPEARRGLVAQLSDMVLFDFVINNPDRWSGNNTKGSPDGARLYFMDHGMSLAPTRPHSRVRTYLERSQRFSRRLVGALRALDEATVRAALAWDVEPFPQLLTDPEIAAILARRDAALAYVDGLIATHGEAAVLVFP